MSSFENVVFLAGNKTRQSARNRLARDLHHIATSNILIIGGGGSFGPFAAALQIDGIILHARTMDDALEGVPHAFALDNSGHFPCNYSSVFATLSEQVRS